MAQINKSIVMHKAHTFMKRLGINMSEALKRAWDVCKLNATLCGKKAVTITYKKVDGSIRKALATLTRYSNSNRYGDMYFEYWDLQKCAFRCFKVENLISWSL